MIANDYEFLDAVENQSFINDIALQDAMFWYAFEKRSLDNLKILWLIQQSFNVSFSYLCLEATYSELANINQILDALSLFHIKPTSFCERVINEGSTEQIQRLHGILRGITHE